MGWWCWHMLWWTAVQRSVSHPFLVHHRSYSIQDYRSWDHGWCNAWIVILDDPSTRPLIQRHFTLPSLSSFPDRSVVWLSEQYVYHLELHHFMKLYMYMPIDHFTIPSPLSMRACVVIVKYSLRSIILFANMDVSTTKMCLDTSMLTKSIMSRREYCFDLFRTPTSVLICLRGGGCWDLG
jgi:hypothetical protein